MVLTPKNKAIKYNDSSWDFKSANTKEYTHCFHSYPAMMIPQVARRIIEKFENNLELIFDPFCGTGTSLVEANLKDIPAIGTDLNPLARLIATAKTTTLSLSSLRSYLKRYNDFVLEYEYKTKKQSSINPPTFKNIDFWFSKDVKIYLTIIKNFIESEINEETIKNFFKVAFSETIRDSSLTKKGEFKLVRMSGEQMTRFNPNVFSLMKVKLLRNFEGLRSFIASKKNGSVSDIYSFNSSEKIPQEILEEESIDLVVTSPPYGDSKTTVAYGQFSRLTNQWLGYEEASKVDNLLMGGTQLKDSCKFTSKPLNSVIDKIGNKDSKRVKDVIAFFKDYENSINNLSRVIKRNGYACFVVGNRSVKEIMIPTDEITKDMFEKNGFEHKETIVRSIPSKRMPSKNSPSNKKGEKQPTMKNEFIVICQKH